MLKYTLCFIIILLITIDAIIFIDFKKYIKLHANELVENHSKELLIRCTTMTIISLCVGVISIVIRIIE